MVRKLHNRRSEVQDGGRRAQSQQDPRDRHAEQLRGVLQGVAVSAGVAHEPRAQVRAVVTVLPLMRRYQR